VNSSTIACDKKLHLPLRKIAGITKTLKSVASHPIGHH
jgi:hypothetical protein